MVAATTVGVSLTQMSSFSMHMSGALLLASRDGDTLDVHLRRTAARVTAEERAAEQAGAAERPSPELPQDDGGAASPGDNDAGTFELRTRGIIIFSHSSRLRRLQAAALPAVVLKHCRLAGGWDDAAPAYDDDGDDGAAGWDGGASARKCC